MNCLLPYLVYSNNIAETCTTYNGPQDIGGSQESGLQRGCLGFDWEISAKSQNDIMAAARQLVTSLRAFSLQDGAQQSQEYVDALQTLKQELELRLPASATPAASAASAQVEVDVAGPVRLDHAGVPRVFCTVSSLSLLYTVGVGTIGMCDAFHP